MEKTAKQELVRRCAALMGHEQLAARLGVPLAFLEAWVRGDMTMPNGYLLPLATTLNQVAGEATLPGTLQATPASEAVPAPASAHTPL